MTGGRKKSRIRADEEDVQRVLLLLLLLLLDSAERERKT